jgi:hypothetical protein
MMRRDATGDLARRSCEMALGGTRPGETARFETHWA